MSLRFWRNIACFYCGSGSAYQHHGKPGSFRCPRCEATNFIDKNGNITEPPPPPTPAPNTSLRFARSGRSPPLPQIGAPPPPHSNNPFCDECLRNQLVAREVAASYLPDDERSQEYRDRLVNYPQFEKELHERYPQCCANCAPRVKQQIIQASKVAKSDYLRRLMDRSKMFPNSWQSASYKEILTVIGGWAWWLSLSVSFMWHALAAAVSREPSLGFEEDEDMSARSLDRISICAGQMFQEQQLTPSCAPDLRAWMPTAIMIGMMTIWWNPRMRRKQQRPGLQYSGHLTFYSLQLLSLGLRWSAWIRFEILGVDSPYVRTEAPRGIHAFIFIGLIMLTWLSHKAIKVAPKPGVNLNLRPEDILPGIPEQSQQHQAPTQRPKLQSSPRHQPFNFSELTQPRQPQHFPLETLMPRSNFQPQRQQNPPTPPPEPNTKYSDYYDPADAMDWSPSTPSTRLTLHPQNHRGAPATNQTPQGPTPFRGTLPPAPTAPAHRLRNPLAYHPTQFRKASTPEKENIFRQRTTAHSIPLKSGGDGNGRMTRSRTSQLTKFSNRNDYTTEDDTDVDAGSTYADSSYADSEGPYDSPVTHDPPNARSRMGVQGKRTEMPMAEPRFFAPQDMRETGLEDLFGGRSFGLGDGGFSSGGADGGRSGDGGAKSGEGFWGTVRRGFGRG